jgi:hypothetical protein
MHPVGIREVPWEKSNGAVTEVAGAQARMVNIPGTEEQGLAPSGPIVEPIQEGVRRQALPELIVELL